MKAKHANKAAGPKKPKHGDPNKPLGIIFYEERDHLRKTSGEAGIPESVLVRQIVRKYFGLSSMLPDQVAQK